MRGKTKKSEITSWNHLPMSVNAWIHFSFGASGTWNPLTESLFPSIGKYNSGPERVNTVFEFSFSSFTLIILIYCSLSN